MLKYISKRLLRSFLTLFIIMSITFILMRQMPIEGYFQNYDKLSEAQIQNGIRMLGLDKPMPVQLFNFYKNLLKGDLGMSLRYRNNVPVTEILAPKIPVSVRLGVMAILLALILGLPLGTLMARYKGKLPDHLGTAFIVFIQAVPAAVYYLFLQLYGTELLGLGLLFDPDKWTAWILPVFSMSLGNIAYYAMWLRRFMVDQSTKDYVQLAKIKGVSGSKLMFRHIFRNAFVPMVQYLPATFLNTVIGSIYIESLYSIPGMGGLLVDVIKKQDNTMVQGIVLLFATVGVIGLVLGDLLMVVLDPRISFGAKRGNR
ncbi:MAG: Oligopeptide transport system permease protein OppB [Firmicutes bacterium ADurb.Bin182]|nr:MAG: Oligopeptide transport system permease protein OppB [Firmicutes bacterium ADurb.Bin182]